MREHKTIAEDYNGYTITGIAKFVHAITLAGFNSPKSSGTKNEKLKFYRNRQKFGLYSKWVSHFAEIFGYDEQTVRKAIVDHCDKKITYINNL